MEKRLSEYAQRAYRNLCQEIFERARRVAGIRKVDGPYDILELEAAALHIRKICESYAFLGILGNEPDVLAGCKSLQRTHKITEILKSRDGFRGDILPQPVHFQEKGTAHKDVAMPITKERLLSVHGRVSFFLHQINPFRTDLDVFELPDLLLFPDYIVDTLSNHELANEYGVVWGYTDDDGRFSLAFGEILTSEQGPKGSQATES